MRISEEKEKVSEVSGHDHEVGMRSICVVVCFPHLYSAAYRYRRK